MCLNKGWKKILSDLILIVFVCFLCLSIYKVVKYKIDENRVKRQMKIIENKIEVIEVSNDKNVEVIEQSNDVAVSNPYWDYVSMNMIDVNFSNLKSINNDVKGWIKVNGTNINYPFVQGNDNEYYLKHSFDKSYNTAGWVFLDYRNDLSNFRNKNTIIYAHGMKNKTMFGSLRNILTSGWLNNVDNYVIKLSTAYENTLWQVFSVYHTPTKLDYIQTMFNDDNEFEKFVNTLMNRSSYNFNTVVSSTDRILTLSTCYNDTDKVVMHAKLIKRIPKK